eukprot:5218543-Pleurochrysis_carterae.AAC.2
MKASAAAMAAACATPVDAGRLPRRPRRPHHLCCAALELPQRSVRTVLGSPFTIDYPYFVWLQLVLGNQTWNISKWLDQCYVLSLALLRFFERAQCFTTHTKITFRCCGRYLLS